MKKSPNGSFQRKRMTFGIRMIIHIIILALIAGVVVYLAGVQMAENLKTAENAENADGISQAISNRLELSMLSESEKLAFFYALMSAGISVCVGLALMMTIRTSLRTLKLLRKGIECIIRGEYENVGDARTNGRIAGGESERVVDTLNQFSDHLQTNAAELKTVYEKYKRFVPQELFELIGKETVCDVNTGQYARKDITLVHTKISGFYLLTKNMDDRALLQFFNRFLARTVKTIKREGGFAEQYRRDGMTAIFSENVNNALIAALKMQEMFKKNAKDKSRAIDTMRIHTALHAGNMMLGVVGAVDRLEVAVISGHEDTVSRICNLSGELGAFVIVTEPAFKQIENRDEFQFRYIGKVIVGGHGSQIGIYDFYDEDPEAIRDGKRMSRESFERGVNMFYKREFAHARNAFIESLRIFAGDKAAISYLFLCEQYKQGEPPPESLGVVKIG